VSIEPVVHARFRHGPSHLIYDLAVMEQYEVRYPPDTV
ncbi:uncharacterized protein METZ01_LOCUS236512, partial [marine metagenome]